jgi:hypothetical protein
MLMRALRRLYRRLPVIRELRDLTDAVRRGQDRMSTQEALRWLDRELRNDPRFQDDQRLLSFQAQICSQHGEDGIIREIFRRIGTTNRVFCELGVGNGAENNTAFLLSQGWTGYWIDADDDFVTTIQSRTDLSKDDLQWLVTRISRENVGRCFQQMDVPLEFDLLSLDIDQNTYYVWEGLAAYRPRVVVTEYNGALPPDIDWKVRYDEDRRWDGTQNFGASLKAFENLGRRLGYSLVGCEFIGANAFFVRDDLVAGRFAEPFTAENHYEPPRYSLSFRRCHPPAMLDRAGGSS